ncbi:thymidylate kinase-like isoform X1 [Juglans regia]|nr:thymidylate kinase-like isoform X1 [Juglans regia]
MDNLAPNNYNSHLITSFDISSLGRDMTHVCCLTLSRALYVGGSALGNLLKSRLNFPQKYLNRQIRMATTHNSIVTSGSSKSRGALIVLEGLDRSGKTSQSSSLLKYLERLGHSAELWRFPDRSSNVGQMISSYLSNKSQLDDHTIHLLFSANRWERRSLMETKLKTGTTLIVDRYSYSGVAFSSAKGFGVEWCKAPEIGLLAPDLVLYLDIQPEQAAGRGGYGSERYEQLEFQRKVAQCYQDLYDASWKIIDACQPMEDIEKQLQNIVLDCVTTCQKGKPLSNLWSI